MKDLKKKLKELKDLVYDNVAPFTLDELSAIITRINEIEIVLKQKQNGKC